MQTPERRPYFVPRYHSWSGPSAYHSTPFTPESVYSQDGYFGMPTSAQQDYAYQQMPSYAPFVGFPEPMHRHTMAAWQTPSYITSSPYDGPSSAYSTCRCSSGHGTPDGLGSPLLPSTPVSMSGQPTSFSLGETPEVSFDYFDAAVQYQAELCPSAAEQYTMPTEEIIVGLGISFKQPELESGFITPPSTPKKASRSAVSPAAETPVVRRKWTATEDEALAEAVTKYASCAQKWKKVSAAVGNRHAKLCAKRWDYLDRTAMKGVKRGRWTYDEDVVLSQLVHDWTSTRQEKINWNQIASMLPHLRSGTQAQARYTETLDPNIKKGWWTPEEIVALQTAIELYGTCWRQVALDVPGRTQRQCRMRYLALSGTNDDEQCESA